MINITTKYLFFNGKKNSFTINLNYDIKYEILYHLLKNEFKISDIQILNIYY